MKVLIKLSAALGYFFFSVFPAYKIQNCGNTKPEPSIKVIALLLCNLQFLLQIPNIFLFFKLFSSSNLSGNRVSKRRQCLLFFSLCSFLIILGFCNSYLLFSTTYGKQWDDCESLAKDTMLAGAIVASITDCAIWTFNLNVFFRVLFETHEARMKYLRRIYDSIIILLIIETIKYYYDAIGCWDTWAPLLILQHPIFCVVCLRFILSWLRKAKMRRLFGSRRNNTHNESQLMHLGGSSLMISVFFFLILHPLKRFSSQADVLNPTCTKLKKYLYVDIMLMLISITIQSCLFIVIYIRCKKMNARVRDLQSPQVDDTQNEEEQIDALLHLMKPSTFSAELQEIPEIQSEMECTICMEAYEVDKSEIFFIVNCCHIFHYKCLRQWVKHRKRTCPKCRALITIK